jgi:hypothetical protein
MQDTRYLLDGEKNIGVDRPDVNELPLKVAPDWDDLVLRANKMTEVIDRHLEFESKLQGRELRPVTLCPEQRVNLATDLSAI